MAISRDKKQDLVAKVKTRLEGAKATAYAKYDGLSVKELQELRRKAREVGVEILVVKNRLVIVAMKDLPAYKDTSTTDLNGQLLYATSAEDEVAPAQVLDKFAADHAALELKGGFSGDGIVMSQADITALAKLPSKNQLIAEVIAQLLSPLTDTVSGLGGNLHALLDGVEAKATS
ncbi:50S ribosomal protein L10 [Candidatus Saccharibacteria bacterium]|nr:50S ribosomal protein L10 [Candidatus Saccharibacteria bacterium]